jgi:tRNA 2-thiocytidine biosynthesis protein TtcA
VPIKYELLAVHIDFGYSPAQVEELSEYLREQGYQHHIEKRSLNLKPGQKLNCFWCSWNRRKALFEVAERFSFNKIALAHNKDDLIEIAFLNLFYHGEISTMLPRLEFFNRRLLVIRPLVNIEACELKKYANIMGFHYQEHRCPLKVDTTKRTKMRKLISSLSRENPHIKRNILKSIEREKIVYKPRRMLGLK